MNERDRELEAFSTRPKTRLSSANHARRRRRRASETQGAEVECSETFVGRRFRGRVCGRGLATGNALPLWKRGRVLRGIFYDCVPSSRCSTVVAQLFPN